MPVSYTHLAEVVLKGDRRECLRRGFDLDVLLGFDRLMQSVRIAASLSLIHI